MEKKPIKIKHNFKILEDGVTIEGQVLDVDSGDYERGEWDTVYNNGKTFFLYSYDSPEIREEAIYVWGDIKSYDNNIISHKFETPEDAQQWLENLREFEMKKTIASFQNTKTGKVNLILDWDILGDFRKVWTITPKTELKVEKQPEFKEWEWVLVRDNENKDWKKTTYLFTIKGNRYVCVNENWNENYIRWECFVAKTWSNIKKLPKQVTKQQIADWQGVSMEDLEIID